jgi:hypothetical protein
MELLVQKSLKMELWLKRYRVLKVLFETNKLSKDLVAILET